VATRILEAPSLDQLRRRLAGIPGLVPATLSPTAGSPRALDPCVVPAELIEPAPVVARAVGAALAWPGPVAFLDGIQRYEVIAYAGAAPLVVAEVAAAVRERVGRELCTVLAERRRMAIARPAVLAAAAGTLSGMTTLALRTEEPVHPLRDLELARAAVDAARSELERRIGAAYRSGSPHWLVVDGSLVESPGWAADPKMVGVVRSHATLPFTGADLVAYLQLPVAHRSNIFRPASHHRTPVYAWGLRLWDWAGKDLLYGLVRVEAAPGEETLRLADTISRWLLAERAPVSADAQWDSLLYGIHSVKEYLKAVRGER